jgi:putative spermidine/putrescine transport system ATP-binding protein
VGHVIFTLPFMVRSVIAIMNSVSLKEFEEGAASLGAGFWQRFFQVVIPNAMPGILAGSLMVFTLSIGEFNLTWMLHTPMTKTLPVGLADSYASMRLEIGSAYTIIFFLMIIPLLIAMQWVAKPRQREFVMEKSHAATGEPVLRPIAVRIVLAGSKRGRKLSGTALRLVNCAKTFVDGTRALEPFNLKVEAGETVVILALRMRQNHPAENHRGPRVTGFRRQGLFQRDDVTDVPIEKRNVGMVFQSYALYPNMTVAENIAYGLKVRGIEAAPRHQRVSEMLDMMKIGQLQNRHIDQLSGGQKQRVALARAIAVRPKVLLLDEPLTALDAKLRDLLRVEIDSLLRSLGITAIYVTHDQSEAMALGDRIVVMNTARVAQVGSPREIYFEPQTRFVAEFIGTINRLKGRLRRTGWCSPGQHPAAGVVCGLCRKRKCRIVFRPEHRPGRVRSRAPPCDSGGLLLHGRSNTIDHRGLKRRLSHDRNEGHSILHDRATSRSGDRSRSPVNPGPVRLMLIAQISDFHLKPEGVLAYRVAETASALRRAVEHINHLQPIPDAVLITGDLVDEGAFESYQVLRGILASLKPPFFMVREP